MELNHEKPYYKQRGSTYYLWWMWHGNFGHWVLNQSPGEHGGDRMKSEFGDFGCPQAR